MILWSRTISLQLPRKTSIPTVSFIICVLYDWQDDRKSSTEEDTVIDHWKIDKERLSPALIRCEKTSGREGERHKSLVNRKLYIFALLSLVDSHRSILQHPRSCWCPFDVLFRYHFFLSPGPFELLLICKFFVARRCIFVELWRARRKNTSADLTAIDRAAISNLNKPVDGNRQQLNEPIRSNRILFHRSREPFHSNGEYRQNSSAWSRPIASSIDRSTEQSSDESLLDVRPGTNCQRSFTSCDRREVRRFSFLLINDAST